MIELLKNRDEFGKLIDSMGLQCGAEVGVKYGDFSVHLLKRSKLRRLYSIDRWDLDGAGQDRHGHYRTAQDRLRKFGDRSVIMRTTSRAAAAELGPEHLDFVYIDANKGKATVEEYLAEWWPVVRPGGVMAGHDYVRYPGFGIIEAVDEFAEQHDLEVRLTGHAGPLELAARHKAAIQNFPKGTPTSVKFHAIPSWWIIKCPAS